MEDIEGACIVVIEAILAEFIAGGRLLLLF